MANSERRSVCMLWEELTAKEFVEAREKAKGVCLLPIGVIEKHGTHLPLGTDMLTARYVAVEAAKIEPAVIFPYFCFGQIYEARHVPGTIAISPGLMFSLLEEVCDEISRNGFKKIIILNCHGGNPNFIRYFIQTTLYKEKDYIVFSAEAGLATEEERKLACRLLGTDDLGGHAGNSETSRVLAIDPSLVKMEDVDVENIESKGRLDHLKNVYTAIGWYANHPAHFAGEPFRATAEAGREILKTIISRVAGVIRDVKNDTKALELQREFFSQCRG